MDTPFVRANYCLMHKYDSFLKSMLINPSVPSFKRSEYSVSVASATTTTRTISNSANGKRAMSIQALNANSFQRVHNAKNRKGPYGRRDHSAGTR